LIEDDEGMADKKDNKPPDDDSPFNSSGELFETLFREELDTLTDGQKEKKAAPKTDKRVSEAKRPKSPAKVKSARHRKAAPQPAAESKKDVKQKPASRVHVDRPQRVSNKPAAKTSAVAEKRPVSADKGDAPEEVRPKKRTKMRKLKEIKSSEIGSLPKLGGGGSDKIKIAVLCVILVAAVAFIANTLGIVDIGGLLGLSEPAKKERIEPRVAKRPPAKTDKKTTRVAIKPPQKRTSKQATNKPTIQKKTLIVKKPPQAAPSKAQPGTVKKSTQPTSPAKKPVIAQQRYRPATPAKRPPAVQQPPKPPPPDSRPVVVMKPSQPAPTTQKPVVSKKPYRPAPSQPSPVVTKKPLAVATPKPPPLIREPARPAAQSGKKPALGKEELFPEESSVPYPYSVYLGSYQTLERAERAVSRYRKKGLSAYWVEVHLGEKGVWYRVFAGHFKGQNEAEAFIKRKRLEDAKVKRTKYSTLIGVYATESDAQKKFLALSGRGYSPYVIETNSGESQLYVGAFYTQIGAERLHKELASKGIRSRVVER
jgi:cell division septation protein DedD